LSDEHQRRHSGIGDRDIVDTGRPVKARDVRGQRIAELGNAQVVRVERLARFESVHPRLPDEVGRDLVGLAEPEGKDVAAPDSGVGDFADPGSAKRANCVARQRRSLGQIRSLLESGRISHNRRDVGKRTGRDPLGLRSEPAFALDSREGLSEVGLKAWCVAKRAIQDRFHAKPPGIQWHGSWQKLHPHVGAMPNIQRLPTARPSGRALFGGLQN
jgi:hypothetical protein